MSAFDVHDLLRSAGEASAPSEQPLKVARAKPPLSAVVVAGCVRIVESVMIAMVALTTLQIRPHALGVTDLVCAGAMPVLGIGLLQAVRAYRFDTFCNLPKTAIKLVVAWTGVVLSVAVVMAAAQSIDGGTYRWLTMLYAAGLCALLAGRAALLVFVRAQTRQGAFTRLTAIVGGGPAGEALIGALEASNDGCIQIIGVFDDRGDDRSSESVAGYPTLGAVNDLVAYARAQRVDLIVFTLPITAENRILQMLAKLWVLPIDIRLSAHSTKLRLRPRAYSYLGKVPVLDVFDKPLADWDVIIKAIFDRVVALIAIVFLSPILLGAAIAVRCGSPGPVLFRQKRYGFNNELIEIYKFRSMYVDQGDAKATTLVSKNDPRVTPIGRIIRKTSLDELPQLFNVLKGDLSLVGPRPHALEAKAANTLYDQVVDGYFARHKVKPGITGWAQIHGWRGETDTSEKIERRVEHDLHYIETWSLWLDIKILAKTPFALLDTKNAY